MTSVIAHRGPDHEGQWNSHGQVSLGYRRLAILDLTADGEQPMVSRSGRFVIVFNGEIYNYVELRAELSKLGTQFRGRSDTEVLVEAIDRWGTRETLARLVGMFAYAVWDTHERTLTLSRDRVGKKPLYYAEENGNFYFASEIKAIRTGAGVRTTINTEALHHYLTLGYVPGARTIFQEVQEVPPGNFAELVPGRPPRLSRYWSLPRPEPRSSPANLDAELEGLLGTAVRQRLRADVEVGVFLSGGVDSGVIAALAAREGGRPPVTFTVAFDDPTFDETERAAETARHIGASHEVIRLSQSPSELVHQVARAYDEPFGDPSAVPTLSVSRAAATRVKVILNGEGADELFGGYRRHLAIHRLEPYLPVVAALPGVRHLADALPFPGGFRTPYSLFFRGIRGVGASPAERYISWSSDGFTESEKRRLMPDAVRPSTAEMIGREAAWPLNADLTTDFMGLDFRFSLADCLLVKMDTATMAYGLEARSPFLDHRVVEWAARLPRELIFSSPGTKPLLRQLAQRLIPKAAASSPKQGFEIPLSRWVNGELQDLIVDTCLDSAGLLCEIMDQRELRALVEKRWSLDEERWSKLIWTLLMLALWHRSGRDSQHEARSGCDSAIPAHASQQFLTKFPA